MPYFPLMSGEWRSTVSNGKRSRSIERAFAVLCAVAEESEPVGVSAIARRTALPKSTVHLALQTMRDLGFVEQDLESERYVLGLVASQLGAAALDQSRLVASMAPGMKDLASRSKEAVSLGIQTDRQVLFIKRFETSHVLRTSIREGTRMPLHASASGKCLLAGMADEEIDRMFPSDPLPASASRTIRTREQLMLQIQAVRERGYATNCDEFLDGVSGAAVPVQLGNRTVASVSLAGPTGRVQAEEWVDDLLAITQMPDPPAMSARATDRSEPREMLS